MSLIPLHVLGTVHIDLNGHPDRGTISSKPGLLVHKEDSAPKKWFEENISTLDFIHHGQELIRYEDAGQLLGVIPAKSSHSLASSLTLALNLPQNELVADYVAFVQHGPSKTFGIIARTTYLMVFDEGGPQKLVERINSAHTAKLTA